MSSSAGKARPTRPAVIVEIGNDWFKIVHAIPNRRGVSFSKLHLEKFASLDGEVPTAIAAAVKRLKLPRIPVMACLPRQAVNVRMIELPSVDPAEIGDMVDLQAGKQTPYSKDEIVSDYHVVDSRREGYSRVVLAIVQRSVLRQRYHLLEEAGLDVASMAISTEGVLNWFLSSVPSTGPVGVLDVDSYYADFLVIDGGQLLFTRSILVGANQLLGDESRWADKLAQETQSSCETFQVEMPDVSIERLVLTGAAAAAGAATALEQRLGVPVEVVDSVSAVAQMPQSPVLDEGDNRAVSLTAAVGVALAPHALQFGLVPDSVRMRKGLALKAKVLSTLGVLVMCAMVTASLLANIHIALLRGRQSRLSSERALTGPAVAEIQRMEAISKAVRQRGDARFAALSILSDVHARVPANVVLDRFDVSIDKMEVVLAGTAGQRRDISTFIKSLESSSLFENVHEGGSTTMDSRTRKYKFQVVCTLETES